MITPAYVHSMARYGAWQNGQLKDSCAGLSDADLRAERGAFFGSLFATMNHVLWADMIWLSRFAPDQVAPPAIAAADNTTLTPDFAAWAEARAEMDARAIEWSGTVTQDMLDGPLAWYSGTIEQDLERPFAICVTHFFNHQTHHRGQMHQMLSELGAPTPVSDLIFMPEEL